jgi:hypothetical protein
MEQPSKKRPRVGSDGDGCLSTAQRFERLLAWVEAGGGSLARDCVELCNDPQLGFHIRARRDLAPGETVLSVPASLMLTEATLRASPLAAALADGRFYADHEVAVEAYHEELAAMSGEELLADVLRHRAQAGRPLDLKDHASAREPMTDRGLLVVFLVHARFGNVGSAGDCSAAPAPAASLAFDLPPDGPTAHASPRPPPSWAAFAQSFPDHFNLPLVWAPANLRLLARCLLGHGVLRSVAAVTRLVADDFGKLRARFAGPTSRGAALRALLGPALELPTGAAGAGAADDGGGAAAALAGGWGEAAFERLLWASAAASSRSFGDVSAMAGCASLDSSSSSSSSSDGAEESLLGGGRRGGLGVMVPALDFLNHDPEGAQIEWVAGSRNRASSCSSSEGSNSRSRKLLPRAVLRKKVRAGGQVLTQYGASRPNDELLICYGFAAWPAHERRRAARGQHVASSGAEDVLEVGWGLEDAPGGREAWVDAGGAKLDALVAAIGNNGLARGSGGKVSRGEAAPRERQLAVALARGERIVAAITLAAPLGELVAIARAVAAAAGDQDGSHPGHGGLTNGIGDDAALEVAAWKYLSAFLDGKLAKLLLHLQASLGDRFAAAAGTSDGRSIAGGGSGNETAALSFAEDSAAAGGDAAWWRAVVLGAQGVSGQGDVAVGMNAYATSAEHCVVAVYHTNVRILQRAAAEAAAHLEDL